MIGGASVGMVGIGPQNYSNDERGRNMIFERNWLEASSSVQNLMLVQQPDVTIRNNLVYIPATTNGGFAFGVGPMGNVPNPTRVHVYNNTVYFGGTSSNDWALLAVSINDNVGAPFDQTMVGSTFECKNNILYAPNYADNVVMHRNLPDVASVTTTSNNTASDYKTNPGFSTVPPTALAHFAATHAYANGTGTAVKNWRDFYGTLTQAPPDMGAIVI
jgi:hypothetical protein